MEGASNTTSTLASQLQTFATSMGDYINAGDVLTVMGIALGAGFTIYLVVWGGRKIIASVSDALKGKLKK